jgi:uncharacterized protein (DUF1330 family)
MAKGYWMGRVDVHDLDAYKKYVTANAGPISRHAGRFLVRGGAHEVPEGKTRSRHVVIEFPSYQAALDCYNSDEYQHAITLRTPVSEGDIVIVEGYDGPQPGD